MSSFVVPTRRGFLVGLASALVAAPAIVRASNIMRVYPIDLEFKKLPSYGFASFTPPPDTSYQWIAETVLDEPQTHTIAEMFRAGWMPVPANQWSDKFKIDGEFIRKGGQLLVQRPLVLTEAAMEAQLEAVRAQIRHVAQGFDNAVDKAGGKSLGFQVRRRAVAEEDFMDKQRWRKLNTNAELEAWLDKGDDDGGTG